MSLLLTMFEFKCEMKKQSPKQLVAELEQMGSVQSKGELDQAMGGFAKQVVGCLKSGGRFKYSNLVYDRLANAIGKVDNLTETQQRAIKSLNRAYFLLR